MTKSQNAIIEATYRYLNVENYSYLCSGLTFGEESLRSLDKALEKFNDKTGIPDYVVDCNMRYGYEFPRTFEGPQYLIDVKKLSDYCDSNLYQTDLNCS